MATAPNPILYHDIKPTRISKSLPNIPYQHLERALLIAAIGCAILSLIPNLGWIGAVSLRSISCSLVGVQIVHSLKNSEGKGNILLHIMRLASVALGLAGVAAHLNALVIASIAMDIAFQAIQAGRGTYQKDPFKSLSHASFILIDTFAIIGMLTGGWPFVVTAAALNSAVMFAFAVKALVVGIQRRDISAAFDAACFIALGGIALAGAVRCAKLVNKFPKTHYYYYQNSSDKTVNFYDKHGKFFAQVKPGESISFSLDPGDTYWEGRIDVDENCSINHLHSLYPQSTDYVTEVLQQPMTVAEFPILPIGASAVVTEEPCLRRVDAPDGKNIEDETLDNFARTVNMRPHDRPTSHQRIWLIHRATNEHVQINLESAWEFSSVLQQMKREEKVYLSLDKKEFDHLIRFFNEGNLENLENLNEREVLNLYNAADDLEIERLRCLCQSEIATRLKHFEWQSTALFDPYIQQPRPLNSLITLFDFTPQPLL